MREILFAGERCKVKDTKGRKQGPGPNYFSSSAQNVWLDSQDQLHLKLIHIEDRWFCAEVVFDRPLGHGIYDFYIKGRFDQFDPTVVVGLFLYKDDAHEIDIEFAHWENALGNNLQYVIQPSDLTGNMLRYKVKLHNDCTVHRITWKPDIVSFCSFEGFEMNRTHIIAEWAFQKRYLPATTERVHMNLWLAGGHSPLQGKTEEITISRFSFHSCN